MSMRRPRLVCLVILAVLSAVAPPASSQPSLPIPVDQRVRLWTDAADAVTGHVSGLTGDTVQVAARAWAKPLREASGRADCSAGCSAAPSAQLVPAISGNKSGPEGEAALLLLLGLCLLGPGAGEDPLHPVIALVARVFVNEA